MNKLTVWSYLVLTFLLVSCGGPHLKDSDLDSSLFPVITEPVSSDILPPVVTTGSGDNSVRFSTTDTTQINPLEVTNVNENDDLLVSYKLEIGQYFKFIPLDCTGTLLATKSCRPEVIFSADKPGIYKDNLIITYTSTKNPENQKNVIVPLIGEKKEKGTPGLASPLTLKSQNDEDQVKITTKKETVTEPVVATNPNNDHDLIVTYKMENGANFTLDPSNCEHVLVSKESCKPLVTFTAKEPGTYKDNIIATYTSKKNPDDSKQVILPVTAERLPDYTFSPLKPPVVTTSEGQPGVRVTTLDNDVKTPMLVKNPNEAEDLIVKYEIEKGTNFSILTNDCAEELLRKKMCSPVVVFSAKEPGIYTDNLIVTYSSKSNPSANSKVITPLFGEKKAEVPTDIDVTIVPNLGLNSIDFGKSLIDQPVSQMVTLKNEGNHAIKLSNINTNKPDFTIGKNGSCKAEIQINQSCTVEVIFQSSVTGLKAGDLIVNFGSVLGGKQKTKSAQLIGEKIKDLNDCSGKPCSEPQKPGKIEFAQINGNGVDFGTIAVNIPAKLTVPLMNVGETSLTIQSIEIKGTGFSLKNDCGKVLLPGFCSLEVTFLPKSVGSYSGSIVAKTTDGQSITLPVKGRGELLRECFKKTVQNITALPTYDMNKVVLPFLTSKAGTTAKTVALYGTKVNSYIKSLNRYTVKDGQLVTTFQIPATIRGTITGLDVNLNASKVVLDGYKDTENLCFSSNAIKKCSGKDFVAQNFYALRNPKFWSKYSAPVNDLYEVALLKNITKCGAYDCTKFVGTLSTIKLLELNESELENMKKDGVVSLIITDDTRNHTLPTLTITSNEEIECK